MKNTRALLPGQPDLDMRSRESVALQRRRAFEPDDVPLRTVSDLLSFDAAVVLSRTTFWRVLWVLAQRLAR